MNSTHSWFPCGDISLEGKWHLPQEKGPFPGVVVCHPHPRYGGNMLSNIVVAICQELSQRSIAAFRFNFRGAGNSEGEFGGGIAEQEDVKAALAFILSTPGIDTERIGLAGYSFGASVVLPVAVQDERVGPLALVSPALSDSGWEQFKAYHQAKFLIVGDADFVMPPEQFQQHIRDMADPGQYRVVAGADHFWWGHEGEVAQEVADFFVASFTQV